MVAFRNFITKSLAVHSNSIVEHSDSVSINSATVKLANWAELVEVVGVSGAEAELLLLRATNFWVVHLQVPLTFHQIYGWVAKFAVHLDPNSSSDFNCSWCSVEKSLVEVKFIASTLTMFKLDFNATVQVLVKLASQV